jgi:myo-inositol catabolism protein IolS
VEYARLGQTEVFVSRIGFGCAAIGGYDYGSAEDGVSIAAIHQARELGINFFDTADVYGLGHAEEVLGKALEGRAQDVIVATKVGLEWDANGKTRRNLHPQRIVHAVEESLRRLRIDCIPLYQIHWPDPETPISETIGALMRCQERGQIRFIGCCNFAGDLIVDAQEHGRIESLQMPFSLAEREHESLLRQVYDEPGMATLCYNPLAQGLFTGKFDRQSTFSSADLRSRSGLFQGPKFSANLTLLERIKTVACRIGQTMAQVAIRWILDHNFITSALIGIRTPDQIAENAAATDWRLSPADWQFLELGVSTD